MKKLVTILFILIASAGFAQRSVSADTAKISGGASFGQTLLISNKTTSVSDTVVVDSLGWLKKRTITGLTGYWSSTGNFVYPATIGDSVGINDATPSYPLDVNGQGRFVGNLIINENLTWDNGADLQNDDADTLDITESNIKLAADNLWFDGILGTVGGDVDLTINPNGAGVISVVGTTNYEDNVTFDDAIPNKKYVDDSRTLDALTLTAVNITPTDANDNIIFTNTTHDKDTCFLDGLTAGKILTIRRGDTTNDVVINASDLTTDGATNITNYNLTGNVRSVIIIAESGTEYHIMVIGQ